MQIGSLRRFARPGKRLHVKPSHEVFSALGQIRRSGLRFSVDLARTAGLIVDLLRCHVPHAFSSPIEAVVLQGIQVAKGAFRSSVSSLIVL